MFLSCSRLLADISVLVARVEHVWTQSQSSNAGLDSAVSPRRSCPNRLILFPHLCNYFFLYYWAVSGLRRQVVQVGSGGFESGNAPSFGSTPIFFGSSRVKSSQVKSSRRQLYRKHEQVFRTANIRRNSTRSKPDSVSTTSAVDNHMNETKVE